MKLLVDAQLPVHLARVLQSAGCDTIHTKDYPSKTQPQIHKLTCDRSKKAGLLLRKTEIFLIHLHSTSHLINCCY